MKKPISLCAAFLALLMLTTPVVSALDYYAPTSAAANDNTSTSTSLAPKAYVTPSELLTAILNGKETPTAAEKNYLDRYFDGFLSYTTVLPDSIVYAENDGITMTVRASVYTQPSEDRSPLIYTPSYAIIEGTRYELTKSDDVYTLTLPYNGQESAEVFYTSSAEIPLSMANELLNFAYNDAARAIADAALISKYNQDLAAYNTYVKAMEKYGSEIEVYEAYLEALAEYNRAYAAYEQNQRELEVYNQRYAKYEEYLAKLEQYHADVEKYNEDRILYDKAVADEKERVNNLKSIRNSMIAIDSLFIKPEKTGTLYKALQNKELISMFDKYSSILTTNFNVPKEDIDYLNEASDRLNELLQGYAEAKESSDKEAFLFYKENYEEIRTLFNGLYEKMSSILTPTIFNLICGKLEVEYGEESDYKKWRVRNVLAHIYLICLCLDDSKTSESTWSFYKDDGDPCTFYFSDILEQSLIITDTNRSNPSALSWIDAKEIPNPPMVPTKPREVTKPVEPTVIAKPIAPTTVPEPVKPVEAAMPEYPEGIDHDLIARTESIIGLVQSSSKPLLQRATLTKAPSYPITLSAQTWVFDGITPKIILYGRNGEIVGAFDSMDDLPAPEASYEDLLYTYTFCGFSLSPYTQIDIPDTLTESISVYALYVAKTREYTVKFMVDGRETVKKVNAGELPSVSDIDLTKASDNAHHYAFSHWDTPIQKAYADTTYTAVFSATDRSYTVCFEYLNKSVTHTYTYGQNLENIPSPPYSYVEGPFLYRYKGWNATLSAVTEDKTYTAIYEKVALVSADETPTLSEDGTQFTVSGNGTEFTLDELITLAKGKQKGLTVIFEEYDVTLTLSADSVSFISSRGARLIRLICHENGGFGYAVLGDEEKKISVSEPSKLTIPHGYEDDNDISVRAFYQSGLTSDNVSAETSEGYVTVSAAQNVCYKPIKKFELVISPYENGSVQCEETLLYEGEMLNITVSPDLGYYVESMTLINTATGEEAPLETLDELTMPGYGITLSVKFAPLVYTVTFIYDGEAETFEYTFGEMPEEPEIPLSFSRDGYFYTFTGWSTPISIVTDDATYTAKYYSILEENVEVNDTTAIDGIINRYVIPTGVIIAGIYVGATLLAILIVIIIVLIKRRKKNPKPPKSPTTVKSEEKASDKKQDKRNKRTKGKK